MIGRKVINRNAYVVRGEFVADNGFDHIPTPACKSSPDARHVYGRAEFNCKEANSLKTKPDRIVTHGRTLSPVTANAFLPDDVGDIQALWLDGDKLCFAECESHGHADRCVSKINDDGRFMISMPSAVSSFGL